jgi:hypothetical protein
MVKGPDTNQRERTGHANIKNKNGSEHVFDVHCETQCTRLFRILFVDGGGRQCWYKSENERELRTVVGFGLNKDPI